MNYEDMSDFEINKEIAKSTDGDWHHSDGIVWKDDVEGFSKTFDPCNNPSDAWPIIIANNISINHGKTLVNDEWVDIWFVGAGIPEAQERATNSSKVLRAAMICFLKMKDAENGR